MYSSIFSYNIQRNYPFRWFTPVVFCVGFVVVVLVTTITFATSGYQLIAISTTNPNATLSQKVWFRHWPTALVGGIRPTCDSTSIQLNSQLYTNNTAFLYTLSEISRSDGEMMGALLYANNPLENCTVWYISIDFEGMQQPAGNIGMQQWNALVQAKIKCEIELPETGRTQLNLSTSYNAIPGTVSNGQLSFFYGLNATSYPSLYWGMSMMFMYWIQATNNLYWQNANDSDDYYKGTVVLANEATLPPSDTADITSLDFFGRVSCWFVPFGTTVPIPTVDFCGEFDNKISLLASAPDGGPNPVPSIWYPVESLSKAMYYTILADLGQTSYRNILSDPELLEYYTANFTTVTSELENYSFGRNVGPPGGFPLSPFDSSETPDNTLGIIPSTFSTEYLCQIPKLKPGGTLFISVLVADLIILQAIWHIAKFCVDWYLLRTHPHLRYCDGCLKQYQGHDSTDRMLTIIPGEAPRPVATQGSYLRLEDFT